MTAARLEILDGAEAAATRLDLKPRRWWLHPAGSELQLAALHAERLRRAKLRQWCKGYPERRRRLLDLCRRDALFFAEQFVWVFDPRELQYHPFVAFDVQKEYLAFVAAAIADRADFLCEKSRDIGVSYLNCILAVHRWLFVPGFKTTFCANKLDLVDVGGNPDTIFEKMRTIIRRLPDWMPPPYLAREARLINGSNGNIISGEGGENAGRGGRSSWYVIDEAAHVERADMVNAATSANARCRGWCSSVNGNGNLFFRLRHGGAIRVFTAHWTADPRKTQAWAVQKRAELTPAVFAAEYDIDYGASIEGLMIPAAWVAAAQELYRRLPAEVARWRAIKGTAGMDVGAGRAESCVMVRHGPVWSRPHTRLNPDSVEVALWGLDLCREGNAGLLCYDSVGVGTAMGSIIEHSGALDVTVLGVNVGDPPSDRVWPDRRTSKEKFGNLKGELWWRAREMFNRSWLHLRHLNGEAEGIACPVDELVLLQPGDDELARQLSTPKWFRSEKGKRVLETKDQLRIRGVASPDRADAAILSLHEPGGALFYVGGGG